MSDIDYGALAGNGTGGDPPDGIYNAFLARAALVEVSSVTKLVTEWQVSQPQPFYWSAWNTFHGKPLEYTQDLLDGLGVDRSLITDDAKFEAELRRVANRRYQVRTVAWSGGVNTYVEGPLEPVGGDLPADEPESVPLGSDLDDIPF